MNQRIYPKEFSQSAIAKGSSDKLRPTNLRLKGREPLSSLSLESSELRKLAEELAQYSPELVELMS